MTDRTGRCACGQVSYVAQGAPIIVHCCHCTYCQRESGSAFALNYLIEAEAVTLEGEVETVLTPSASGRGQAILRCPRCHVAVSSHYSMGPAVHFLRVGTMDDKDGIAPGVHIYTSTRQAWVMLDPAVPAFADFYDPKAFWGEETLARVRRAMGKA